MTDVVVVRKYDEARPYSDAARRSDAFAQWSTILRTKAKKRGMEVLACAPSEAEFDRALVVEPGTAVPWDLVGHGFHFVKLWDAAVPLWKYNVLAETQGTGKEREITQALTLDLRIPVYACELLFVGTRQPEGRALLVAWEEERERGEDERLAFLRAVARVKPRLCTLPADWMGVERARRVRRGRVRRVGNNRSTRVSTRSTRVSTRGSAGRSKGKAPKGLVRVEVGPGRFVLARPENAERVRERYRKRGRRGG